MKSKTTKKKILQNKKEKEIS